MKPTKKLKEKIIEKIDRTLRYEFSEKEVMELGKQLAYKNREAAQLEEDKKRVTSDFKAKIDGVTSEISLIGSKISSGYELRLTKCEAHFDTPKIGKKRIIRLDNSDEVAVEDMTPFEMQREMELNDPKKEPAPTTPPVKEEQADQGAD